MLELAILGLLKEHPMHGYDLRKRLRGRLRPALEPVLRLALPGSGTPRGSRRGPRAVVERLRSEPYRRPWPGVFSSAGSIAGERAAFRARLASRRAALEPTRGTGTRGRRVYEITARGDELFHRLLEAEEPKPEGGRGFALRWAFARYLSPEARLSLAAPPACPAPRRPGRVPRRAVESPWRPLDRYQRSLVDHANEATEHDLSWIDRLIAAEQAAQVVPRRPRQPSTRSEHSKARLRS